jgi:two-component system, OmpR family, sensor histidine kinase KdpD
MKIKFSALLINLFQYLVSILVVALVTWLLWILRSNLNIQVIALLYLLPAVFIARVFGLFPAVLAAFLSFLSFNYFFIPPHFTLAVHETQDLILLIIFLIVAIVISQLMNSDRQNLRNMIAREREMAHLYELSIALAGLKDDQSIAQILVDKIHASFTADRVEICLNKKDADGQPICVSSGIEQDKLSVPELTIPFSTARGERGTASVWRHGISLSSAEERMLSTIASQGTLALERANLIEIDNHAKVLEESDKLKSSLLSSVSHELRTPLATIKASISSIRSKTVTLDPDSKTELLSTIEEETDHLNQLVGNLLDMSRIETGALNPQRGWNALNEIANGVIGRMNNMIQNHIVKVEVPENLPLVPVDYTQMDQVFTNLLSNSAKYAPLGTEIMITMRPQDDQLLLVQIKNKSPHLEEEHLDRIFDKFYRVTAADRITGTGLGLSICKGIIEAHGGRIWASNEIDGFYFNFTLPLTWEGSRPETPRND